MKPHTTGIEKTSLSSYVLAKPISSHDQEKSNEYTSPEESATKKLVQSPAAKRNLNPEEFKILY